MLFSNFDETSINNRKQKLQTFIDCLTKDNLNETEFQHYLQFLGIPQDTLNPLIIKNTNQKQLMTEIDKLYNHLIL